MNPESPIYIVSKGRWKNNLTSKALNRMNVPHYVVVERQEYDNYLQHIVGGKVLILPQRYLNEYDTFDDLGDTKSKGPGSARNFCWTHSIRNGHTHHWVMDDNIQHFFRLNKNTKIRVLSGAIFKCAEDFMDRYTNVAISGFNYYMFCKTTDRANPFTLNTRIYSCLLIRNDIPYRWRGRYNEDTDLSLRVLKDGWCTIQFNAFLQEKVTTQRIRGGNSAEFYDKEGTHPKSKMIEDMHPDVAKVAWKFNRWHHQVDYTPFKSNKLIKKTETPIYNKVDNYGMVLIGEERK